MTGLQQRTRRTYSPPALSFCLSGRNRSAAEADVAGRGGAGAWATEPAGLLLGQAHPTASAGPARTDQRLQPFLITSQYGFLLLSNVTRVGVHRGVTAADPVARANGAHHR